MDVTFGSAELAQLCNSSERLGQQWGEAGREVSRRLCDLAAVDSDALQRLPGLRLHVGSAGQVSLSFSGPVWIGGVLTPGQPAGRLPAEKAGILVTSVEAEGTEVR